MKLNLTKPICFFDLETTGTNIAKDRIVEIAILKVFPNGNKESVTWRVNPEMKIPAETTKIHGISDEEIQPTWDAKLCFVVGRAPNIFPRNERIGI